jgi:hypothetical protein
MPRLPSPAALAVALALAACGTTPTQQSALIAGAATLSAVAAAHSTTVAKLVTAGALFCKQASTDAPLVVVLANLSGVPVSVTDASSDVVAAACNGIAAVPVAPPADVTAIPVVMAPSGLPGVVAAKV